MKSFKPSQDKLMKMYLDCIKDKKLIHCLRCNYVWLIKNPEKLPLTCAKCNSPYYNKPRRKDIIKKIEEKYDLTPKITF